MINALLERLEVDPVQWRVLVGALLRIDYPVRRRGARAEQADRATRAMLSSLLAYGLYGITPAVVFAVGANLLTGATVAMVITIFAAGMSLLVGDAGDFIEPKDLQILGYRPVTSRTYLAVRVSTLMFRATLIACATIVPPALVILFKFGARGVAIDAGLLFGSLLAAMAMTLLIVASFGMLLRKAGAEKVQRYVAYMVSLSGFVMWISVLLITRNSVGKVLAGYMPTSPLWMLLPPAWFGAFAGLAGGEWSIANVLGAAAALTSVAYLAWFVRDKLSMSYSTDVERFTSAAAPRASASSLGWIRGLNDETRAVAVLVRSQLEHDTKFRMAFISLLPVTVVYMIMGGLPADPFGARRVAATASNIGLIQVAVMFLPMTLRQVIATSDSHKAAWIFQVTPARRAELVLSSRNLVAICFLFPYLALLAAIFAYAFGDSTHALVHAFFLGLFALTLFQIGLAILPQLPFSRPLSTKDRFGSQLIIMLVTIGAGIFGFTILSLVAYKSPARMAIAVAIMLAIGSMMTAITRWRVNRMPVEQLYFD